MRREAFIFLDQFEPLELIGGRSLKVTPHPHIGLATVTYDSLARRSRNLAVNHHVRVGGIDAGLFNRLAAHNT